MPPLFKKQNRKTLTEIALINIREALESGQLSPGERIIESKFAKEMEISRFPIREALRILEQEGLLITEPFKGFRVLSIGIQEIEELMTVRCALEELAIHLTIKNITSGKITALENIIKEMKEAVKNNDKEKVLNADLKFHEALCHFSENSRLIRAWKPLACQIRICLKMEYPLFTTGEDFVETHEPILNAIKKGLGDHAVKILHRHIYGALDRIISHFNES